MKKIKGKIEDVKLFQAPNDTTKDENQHHKFKINGKWYFVAFKGETPTRTNFDTEDEEVEFKGTTIKGATREITGKRGEKHRMLEIEEVIQP